MMAWLPWLFHQAMRGRLRRFDEDCRSPLAAQVRRLSSILHNNRESEFARQHGFDELLRTHPDPASSTAAALAFARDYRARLPIRRYADFAPAIERMRSGERHVLVDDPVTMYNVTSGSSGKPKHCPITRRFTLEHHASHLLWLYHVQRDHPGATSGPYLTLVSPAASSYAPDGTPTGSSSGRQAQDQAWIVRRRQIVPYETFTLRDYGARHHATLLFALSRPVKAVVAVNPSSLMFLGRLLEERADALLDDLAAGRLANLPAPANPDGHSPEDQAVLERLARLLRPRPERAALLRERMRAAGGLRPSVAWPEVVAIATWQGGSAPFYAAKARELWGNAPMRCLGLRASEGTFTIPLADHTASGVLAVGGGAFLEFVPEDVTPSETTPTLLAHELSVGQRYRLLFTSSGGFYRYDLADIVEVTGMRHATPEVAFTHRAGGVVSVIGEKVTEAQVVGAMGDVAARWPGLAGFAATVEQPDGADPTPRYVLALEWRPTATGASPSIHADSTSTDPAASAALSGGGNGNGSWPAGVDARELARLFDAGLAKYNGEYADKRADGRLGEPAVLALAAGSFARQRRAMVDAGSPDGQVKPPHLFKPSGPGTAPVRPCPFFDHVTVAGRR